MRPFTFSFLEIREKAEYRQRRAQNFPKGPFPFFFSTKRTRRKDQWHIPLLPLRGAGLWIEKGCGAIVTY